MNHRTNLEVTLRSSTKAQPILFGMQFVSVGCALTRGALLAPDGQTHFVHVRMIFDHRPYKSALDGGPQGGTRENDGGEISVTV